jgi:membrane protein required for colicin V production
MQAYDIFMLIVIVAAVVWGAWKGLAWQLASLASIVLSYIVALSFRQPLSQLINASPPWNIFLSMLILFLGTGLIVWIAFNLLSEVIERVKLKEYDRQLGAIFGLAKGVLLCVLITLFAVGLLSEPQRQQICNSKSGYYIAVLLDKADAVIPSELHQVLEPYIDQLDKNVAHPHTEEPWQIPQEIQDLIPKSGQATGEPGGSFPTSGFSVPAIEATPSRSAGRIQAKPAQPPPADYRRW